MFDWRNQLTPAGFASLPTKEWRHTMHDPNDPSLSIAPALRNWLSRALEFGASDVHLTPGYPPVLRVHGDLIELPEPPLEPDQTRELLTSLCAPDTLTRLNVDKNVDFSFEIDAGGRTGRFRSNLFFAGRQLAACLRVVPTEIPDFEWAGFPRELADRLAFLRDGLVIVTGSTGSGKTTTLAMIVNLLNQAGGYRIITVEDPIEYVYPRLRNSLVSQRELGPDVLSFADGLKYGLRHDPDVILVGEIRDRSTAQMALSAAETGHLVFSTLHTRDAKGAISRYADLFPQDVQRDVRSQLAMSLRAIVSQRLLPGLEKGEKRHLALEVLWNTNPIASAIRQGKIESIDNYLMTGREEGMLSIDESVRRLLKEGKISREVAEQNVRELAVLNR
jgi:twitching motility protein PilT